MSEQRALLLTDVVDSTELARRLGDAAMSALWTAHDRAARDLLREWRGREIDKSDGFLLMFSSAADAVGYALAYHRSLAGLDVPLKARAGLHVGPVTLRENHLEDVAQGAKPIEVEGVAKPITARVMSLAQGGQTLLTADARAALGATALRVQGHGHWRIKGLEEPFELFEVGEEGAPFTPPPDSAKVYRVVRRNELWVPMREIRHSLPAERDAFIGREAQLQELALRFANGARLVSVLGIGGTGKSRLAQRFGWIWLGEYTGGVWFCDLSQARSLDGIVYAAAQGLDVPLGTSDPIAQLSSAIAGRGNCLVILDNFEQVSRYAEETVGRWLDRAGEAHFIVTTREVLGIAGEEALALAPMAPSEAAALFLRRAASARRDFHPIQADQDAVEPLVKLLDGLPLAIELAAARVRVMPPRILLQRMWERFKLLASTGGRRDRQATLRATFDWSWDLLTMPEKAALAQLSVFEVGFTLDAVEAVLDLSAFEGAPWSIDVVQSLVEKSLVRQVGDQRFGLLGSVQEYAAEHLRSEGRFDGSGTAAERAAQVRHWRYFAQLDEQSAIVDKCIETENLVAACRRSTTDGDSEWAVRALIGSWAALRLCGPFRVAVELADTVRSVLGLRPEQLAQTEWVAGSAHSMLGRGSRARACFDAGLTAARCAGDRLTEARLQWALAEQLTMEGHNDEARASLVSALQTSREFADETLQCKVLNALGNLCHATGRVEEARTHYSGSLSLANKLGDLQRQGGLLGNLGAIYHGEGNLAQARKHYEQALMIALETGDRRWGGNAHCNLGLLLHEQGCTAEAQLQFEAALAAARELGLARLECMVLCNLGIVVDAQGDAAVAQGHYEDALRAALELADRRTEGQIRGYLGLLYAKVGRREDGLACLAKGEVLLLTVDDPLSLGVLLCNLAHAKHLIGDAVDAKTALHKAETIAAGTSAPADSELGRAVTLVRRLVQS